MQICTFLFSLFFSLQALAICELRTNRGCKKEEVCMNWSKDEKKCLLKPKTAPIVFSLPFDRQSEVVCTHSKGIGSHSWTNAYWSLDLATPYSKPPSIIRAAASGTAFFYTSEDGKKCKNPPGNPQKAEADNCGKSWGNRVKILHDGGYFSFYVHLDQIFIKNGQEVKTGDPIGSEGWTGAAGHRHLHWSVQKIYGKDKKEWIKNLDWDGSSVPFMFWTYLNGKKVLLNSADLHCPHANIGQAKHQPLLKGI